MEPLVVIQGDYLIACDRARLAGIEHAQAKVELLGAERTGDSEQIAIASLRSAYATKLWEHQCRRQSEALAAYNEQLVAELHRQRRQTALQVGEGGRHVCFGSGLAIPEAPPFWLR